jgi:hypothetical protein
MSSTGFRPVAERFLLAEGHSRLIGAQAGIGESRWNHPGRWLNLFSVEGIELLNIIQDGIQLADENLLLLLRDSEVSKSSHIVNFFRADFHEEFLSAILAVEIT